MHDCNNNYAYPISPYASQDLTIIGSEDTPVNLRTRYHNNYHIELLSLLMTYAVVSILSVG